MSTVMATIEDLIQNISAAFVGTIAEMYTKQNDDQDQTLRTLMKENRYMYLALFLLFLMIVGNIMYSTS